MVSKLALLSLWTVWYVCLFFSLFVSRFSGSINTSICKASFSLRKEWNLKSLSKYSSNSNIAFRCAVTQSSTHLSRDILAANAWRQTQRCTSTLMTHKLHFTPSGNFHPHPTFASIDRMTKPRVTICLWLFQCAVLYSGKLTSLLLLRNMFKCLWFLCGR